MKYLVKIIEKKRKMVKEMQKASGVVPFGRLNALNYTFTNFSAARYKVSSFLAKQKRRVVCWKAS